MTEYIMYNTSVLICTGGPPYYYQAVCDIKKGGIINIPVARGAAVLETCRNAGGFIPCEAASGGCRAVGAVKVWQLFS